MTQKKDHPTTIFNKSFLSTFRQIFYIEMIVYYILGYLNCKMIL